MLNLKFSLYKYQLDNIDKEKLVASQFDDLIHSATWFAPNETEKFRIEAGAGSAVYSDQIEFPKQPIPAQKALRFEIRETKDTAALDVNGTLLASQEFTWPDRKAVFRLDQVTFPPNAIAYRHIHSGAGFRHLVAGGLNFDTGAHQQDMVPGDSWFEDINSPVRATAMSGCISQFIRAMLIPLELHGKPTIKILSPEDAAKPTLQKNHRFVDQIIEF
jgi:quercetin dioxygenase-like cupin family protein